MDKTFLVPLVLILFILTWVIIKILIQSQLVSDFVPKNQIGGVAILVSMAMLIVAVYLGFDETYGLFGFPLLLVCVMGLGLVGIVDDVVDLPVLPRLLAQILVAVVLAVYLIGAADIAPEMVGLNGIVLGFLGLLVVVATIWIINAANFFDGIDWGLLGGIIPGLLLFVFTHHVDPLSNFIAIVVVMLLGGLLAYGYFNCPPAKIYLGDGGSLVAGFLIAACIFSGLVFDLSLSILLPFSYFLFDTSLTMLRRLLKRENIFKGHQTHGYQLAVVNGWKVKSVSLTIFAVSTINALVGLVCWTFDHQLTVQTGGGIVVLAICFGTYWMFLRPKADSHTA